MLIRIRFIFYLPWIFSFSTQLFNNIYVLFIYPRIISQSNKKSSFIIFKTTSNTYSLLQYINSIEFETNFSHDLIKISYFLEICFGRCPVLYQCIILLSSIIFLYFFCFGFVTFPENVLFKVNSCFVVCFFFVFIVFEMVSGGTGLKSNFRVFTISYSCLTCSRTLSIWFPNIFSNFWHWKYCQREDNVTWVCTLFKYENWSSHHDTSLSYRKLHYSCKCTYWFFLKKIQFTCHEAKSSEKS